MKIKNRAIQLQLVDPTKTDAPTPPRPLITPPTPEQAAEYATDAAFWIKRGALGAGAAYAFVKIVNTACDIAVDFAEYKFR